MNKEYQSGYKPIVIAILTILSIVVFGYRMIVKFSQFSYLQEKKRQASTEFYDKFTARANLRTIIDTINQSCCPYEDYFGLVDSLSYKNGQVIVYITLDKDDSGCIEAIKLNKAKVTESYLTLYSSPNTLENAIVNTIAKADVDMVLRFYDITDSDSCFLHISSYGVSQAAHNIDVGAMNCILAENELLNIKATNELLNTKLTEKKDMYFTNAAVEGNYRVFYYQCTDFVISHLSSIKDKHKKGLLNSYKEMKGLDRMKEANLGMRFVYRNIKSGKECIITIENDEL